MARSQEEMLRDMLALVRDLKLHTGKQQPLVDEVTAYLAGLGTPTPAPVKVATPPAPDPASERSLTETLEAKLGVPRPPPAHPPTITIKPPSP